MSKNVIPLPVRKDMAASGKYQVCALSGHHGHTCDGRITWEHAIIYGGKKVQLPWAIIPLCEKGHAVDKYQDAGTMVKELNEWVALSRAQDTDILALSGEAELTPLSKVKTIFTRKQYLVGKYGVWTEPSAPAVPFPQQSEQKVLVAMNTVQAEIVAKVQRLIMKTENRRIAPTTAMDIIFAAYEENIKDIEKALGEKI